MVKAETVEKAKSKTKTDEGTDIVSDPSDVGVDASKIGDDEVINGEENGSPTSDQVRVSLI